MFWRSAQIKKKIPIKLCWFHLAKCQADVNAPGLLFKNLITIKLKEKGRKEKETSQRKKCEKRVCTWINKVFDMETAGHLFNV